jgi:iron complex outermembrane receptor protein
VSADEIGESTLIAADPSRRNLGLSGAFVQDEIALVPTVFSLTLGTKLERNSFTGVEVQPSARALYRAGSQSLWAAISRGVRTPSRAERDLDIVLRADSMPDGLGRVVELDASHDFQSENLVAYELGYRWSPHRDSPSIWPRSTTATPSWSPSEPGSPS